MNNSLQVQNNIIKEQINHIHNNEIKGTPLDKYIYNRIMSRVDPIFYCENVLRAHLPEKRKHLHENQIELIRAVCNPQERKVAALMARQAGKTESIASFSGYLLDNYPQMRIGVFTPRIQQAEVNLGRISVFYQMNEDKLNNSIVKISKDKIELSNGSYVMAVSGSDQSNIEGLTFDIIVLDEAQKISDYTWSERIQPMGGACLQEDTLIVLADGTMKTIKQIVEKHNISYLPCLNTDTGHIENHKVIGFHKVGIKNTIKITLENGKTIEGSEIHPLLEFSRKTRNIQWTQLKDLQIGNRVAVAKSLPYFGEFNEPYARVIGMLIGDGCYNNGVKFCNKDVELLNYMKKVLPNSDFNITKTHTTLDNECYQEVYITNCVELLKQCGIYKQTSLQKTLPCNWQNYNKESLQELVGGLFDTDSCVGVVTDKSRPYIEFSNINKQIVIDVQNILLKFGVHCHIVVGKAKDKIIKNKTAHSKQIYRLIIKGKENIVNFYNNFKLLVSYKQERLNQYIKYFKTHKEKVDKRFTNSDIRFLKIINIENSKSMLYDLTVENYHNYIADGIISHNTNAKMIKIGTPKTRNHFYKSFQIDPDNPKGNWKCVKRDWTQCPQLWALDKTMLPDPNTGILRPYSTYVLSLMPKSLKQEMFPNNPEVWFEGGMSVEDFKTQYMLEFIDGAGKFFGQEDIDRLRSGQFNWLQHGIPGERYFAGIDFAGSGAATADFTHITILRIAPNGVKQKVFAYEMHGISYPEQMKVIDNMLNSYNARFKPERIFADYTGVGRPVIDSLIYDYGITNLTGITFNGRDTFTNSGMNLKNVMFAQLRKDVENNRFQYPDKEHYSQSAGSDVLPFYHKMIGEWADLEQETRTTVNKIIQAPLGQHDDVCCADILANFATIVNAGRQMPKARSGHYNRLR